MLRIMLQSAEEPRPGVRGSAVALWLAVQLIGLALGALAVPLWARAPATGEHALHLMLAVQLIALALLFPFLLVNWATAAAVALLALPFIQFSGMVALMPLAAQARALVHLLAWWLALALLAAALHSALQRLWAAALVTGVLLGGAVLEYFRMEQVAMERPRAVSVLLGSLRDFPEGFSSVSFAGAGVVIVIGTLMRVLERRRRRRARQLFHTSSTTG